MSHHHHHPHHHHDAPRLSAAAIALRIAVALVVVGILLFFGMSYQVFEGSAAVVTRFGRPVRETTEAGWKAKLPWPIERHHSIDMRRRLFNPPPTEALTQDRTNVILLSYVVWRVDRPLLFLQAMGTPQQAEARLESIVSAAETKHMGNYPLTALVSTDESRLKIDEIEQRVLGEVQAAARGFGVKVEQLGIKRVAYPKVNMQAALAHMRAERRSKSNELRAQGLQRAQVIRSAALVEAAEIRRTGQEEAGRIRGDAEQRAAQIYEEAQRLDPDFYQFWRTLQMIRRTLGERATIVLPIDEQSPFGPLFQTPPASGAPRPLDVSAARPLASPAAPGEDGAAGGVQPAAHEAAAPVGDEDHSPAAPGAVSGDVSGDPPAAAAADAAHKATGADPAEAAEEGTGG